ncbi:MAG TPA: hypothetical protein VD902_17360 [Symbiobacteriaceae bacterium]|nr:hypothetical protein [Symbiobacteriaceae bacterium]
MQPYRVASLSHDQLMSIEKLENNIGVTLVAYEPAHAKTGHGATSNVKAADADENLVLDALNDTYRTYDPHIH